MSKTTTNLLIVLGVLTLGFGGYYVYTSFMSGTPGMTSNADIDAMRSRTQVFIDYRRTLNDVNLDFAILEEPAFLALRNFRTPIREVPIGRANPFAERESAPTGTDTITNPDSALLDSDEI